MRARDPVYRKALARRSALRIQHFLYRPSLNEEGMPVSQLLGEFQGRSARFSASVVAQPEVSKRVLVRTTAKRVRRIMVFILVKDLVAFHYLIEFPAWNNIRNAAVGLDAGDTHLGHEL